MAVPGGLLASMLVSPAVAGIGLQCRMTEVCVNDFDCRAMEMAVALSAEGSGGASQQGEGTLTLSGEDQVPARYRVDANGILTATVIPEPGGAQTVMRLIVQGKGLGVLSTFSPTSKMSTIQTGVCSVE
jgi:hypothetical protein